MNMNKQYELLVKAVREGNVETVPPGWKTAKEISKEAKKSLGQVTKILQEAIVQKRVEVKKFTIKSGLRTMPIPHYKFV
jgi:hypothetical protein